MVVELGLHQKIEQKAKTMQGIGTVSRKYVWLSDVLALIDEDRRERREQLQDLLNDMDCTLTEEDFTFQAIAGFRTKLQEIIDRTDEKAKKELFERGV